MKGEVLTATLTVSLAEEFSDRDILLEGDSQELVNQVWNLDGALVWRIEAEVFTMRRILQEHIRWSLVWTPREGNYLAHHLAKWGMDNGFEGNIRIGDIPSELVNCDDSASLSRVGC